VYATISGWIAQCTKHHDSCSKPRENFAPSRLIDIGSPTEDPFLFIPPSGKSIQYVALSYCWGTSRHITLTTDKLESKQPRFPLDSLPKKSQDAFIICRKLGFQYIWVDALCIVQDSVDSTDWMMESMVMDDIYGNAALTIAASAAKDTSEGILRGPWHGAHAPCAVPCRLLDGRVGRTLLQYYPIDGEEEQPLKNRAWAFQESLLSPRVLSYQTKQLVWRCRTRTRFTVDIFQNAEKAQAYRRSEKSWRQLVTDYSGCSLTFPSDRLIALAGLANSRLA
jgi:hypothetical protein